MTQPSKTLSPETAELVADYHAKKSAHELAVKGREDAEKAYDAAKDLASDANTAMLQAKNKLTAAFWQDVDPMPLVPAPRLDSGCITIGFPKFNLINYTR